MKPIVIVGAGYGGLSAALGLGRAFSRASGPPVILIDRNAEHELKPKLPEAVGAAIDCAVGVPVADVLRGRGVRFLQARVVGLDPRSRQVLTDTGPVAYERLVWGLGSEPDFAPGGRVIAGLTEAAIAPYSRGQACRLRHHLAAAVWHATSLSTTAGRAPYVTVVVAGGGFVGVELAGELVDRLRELALRHGFSPSESRLVLLEPRESLLGFDPRLNAAALTRLRAKGVDVRLGVGLAAAAADRVELTDGSAIATRTLVWAGGTRGNALAALAGLPVDERGRVRADAYLRARPWTEVYAVGDGVRHLELDRRADLVGSGQAAVDQGHYVARAIRDELAGRPVRPYHPRSRGVAVLLGQRDAIARVGPLAPLGAVAPLVKQLPTLEHLWRLGGPRLAARHLGSTLLPLLAPDRVDRYALAGDRPPPVRTTGRPA